MRWNLADRAWPTVGDFGITQAGSGFGPVIRMYHGPGPARSARPGLAVPRSRDLAPPANTVGFQILDFLQFDNITKRDVFQLFR